jgi:hypothetical protein
MTPQALQHALAEAQGGNPEAEVTVFVAHEHRFVQGRPRPCAPATRCTSSTTPRDHVAIALAVVEDGDGRHVIFRSAGRRASAVNAPRLLALQALLGLAHLGVPQ